MNFWKFLFVVIGLGVFIWGVVSPNWIRMIGGFLLMLLASLVAGD